jgi:hypothetical protein
MVVLSAAFAISGCGFADNKQKAEAAVQMFHRDFNAGKFADIYSAATPAFRTKGPEADFDTYLRAIHTKIGGFKSAQPGVWRVNTVPEGTFVELNYDSRFESGSGAESFTYLMSDGQPKLYAYNINSRDLVVK